MSLEDHYEHAKFVICRFDHYNDSVNSKGAFYIGLNTFMLGGLIAVFASIPKTVLLTYFFWTGLIMFVVFNILSSILIIFTISPYLIRRYNKLAGTSSIFFASVASKPTAADFAKDFLKQSKKETVKDTIQQTWHLARVVSSKYKRLQWVGWLIVGQFAILTPIISYLAYKWR